MGNTNKILSTQSLIFQSPVNTPLLFLTKWSNISIKHFYQHYLRTLSPKLHLTSSELAHISSKTPIEPNIKPLFEFFSSSKYKKLNILELLSVIITYSELVIDKKINLIFQIFDFDKSRSLTKDEVIIMSRCYFRGIQTAISVKLNMPFSLETTSIFPFVAEINPSDSMLLPEFLKWVKNQRILVNLLSTYSVPPCLSDPEPKFISRTFDRRCLSKHERAKRYSEDQNFVSNPKYTRKKYALMFSSVCNRLNKAQAGVLYQELMADPSLYAEANIFYSLYHLKLKTEMTLNDFLNTIKKIKDICYRNCNQSKKMISRQHTRGSSLGDPRNTKISLEILKKLFDRYDTNHDGFVDLSELKSGLRDLLTTSSIEEIFKLYDEDSNRVLDFSEFIKLFSISKPKSPAKNRGYKSSFHYY